VRSTLSTLADALGAEFEDNILWKLNKSITVHPLGGCPLGATEMEGVVDPERGEVHNYPGLHVADGSVMPGTVGTNPSFTIAALSDRFADGILRAEGKL
jgi:cholesterol oxidase